MRTRARGDHEDLHGVLSGGARAEKWRSLTHRLQQQEGFGRVVGRGGSSQWELKGPYGHVRLVDRCGDSGVFSLAPLLFLPPSSMSFPMPCLACRHAPPAVMPLTLVLPRRAAEDLLVFYACHLPREALLHGHLLLGQEHERQWLAIV